MKLLEDWYDKIDCLIIYLGFNVIILKLIIKLNNLEVVFFVLNFILEIVILKKNVYVVFFEFIIEIY